MNKGSEAAKRLSTYYREEVVKRGGELIVTDELRNNIISVGEWIESPSKRGMAFLGTVGNGKTTLLYAIKRLMNGLGKNLWIKTALELSAMAREDSDSFKDFIQRPYVAVDDVGMEPTDIKSFGNVISPFTEIIHYRYDKMMPTIISSNLDGKELGDKYGERIADRMAEMFGVLIFTEKSFRRR